ncbi:MAG: tautomerase family protein [Firmicutes bacterium]|nr:tautomerase family protein [Bacillota bacterium]
MPHIIVKIWPGKDENKKIELAEGIKELTVKVLGVPETSVSVGIEEISQEDWPMKVYKPDIIEKDNSLYVRPGYKPEVFN